MTAPKPQADTTPPVTAPAARQAPATPSQSPFVVKARELERQLEAESDRKGKEKSARRHALEAQLADLRRVEGYRMGGANPRAPMGEVMRRPLVEAALRNPEKHLRWVDESKEGRVDYVKQLGYEKLSEGDGGRQFGKSALYAISRERHGELEAAKRMRTASQLRAPKSELRQEAEKLVEELNEQGYGPFNAKDVLINEE